jgi:2-oxo-4-hydroxy-4-carboxy-5-ureidoimidazoline decarboxylase
VTDATGPVATFAPDTLPAPAFADLVAPLFERAPRFIRRLEQARPFGSWDALFGQAQAMAMAMPHDEQLELIDAHPRIGAPPGSVSAYSFVEQGYDRETAATEAEVERERIAAALERLNDAYEARCGFRYVIFVAGRPRAAIVPLLEAALQADPDTERARAIRDVVAIARDRAAKGGLIEEAAAAPHGAERR